MVKYKIEFKKSAVMELNELTVKLLRGLSARSKHWQAIPDRKAV